MPKGIPGHQQAEVSLLVVTVICWHELRATHRIFRPLLAFVSTFLLTFRLSF